MLVQKQANQRVKYMIIIGSSAIVLVLLYILYLQFSGSSISLTNSASNPSRPALPSNFGQSLFNDTRFNSLQPVKGTDLMQQTKLVTPATDLPAPEKLKVLDMQTGGHIFFSWQRPTGTEAVTLVRINQYVGNTYQNIVSLKPTETSYVFDQASNSDINYLVYYVKESILKQSPQTKIGEGDDSFKVSLVNDNKVTLSWTNLLDQSAKILEVYRSDTVGKIGKLITALNNSDTQMEDTVGSANYFYTLIWCAEVQTGKTAQMIVKATDQAGPNPVSGLIVAYDEALPGVKLTWQPSNSTDVTQYQIHKSTVVNVLGPKIGTVSVNQTSNPEQQQVLEFLDKNADKNSTFYYSVIALDATGNSSTTQTLGVAGNVNPFNEP